MVGTAASTREPQTLDCDAVKEAAGLVVALGGSYQNQTGGFHQIADVPPGGAIHLTGYAYVFDDTWRAQHNIVATVNFSDQIVGNFVGSYDKSENVKLGFTVYHLPVKDDAGGVQNAVFPDGTLDRMADLIHQARVEHPQKAICSNCFEGRNRSATALCAYLLKYQRNFLEEKKQGPESLADVALKLVRADTSGLILTDRGRPGFIQQLREFDQALNAQQHRPVNRQ